VTNPSDPASFQVPPRGEEDSDLDPLAPAPRAARSPNITVTPRAAQEVKRIIRETRAAEGTRGPLYLRLRTTGNLQDGFQDRLDLDPETTADDHRIDAHGLVLVVDSRTTLLCAGAVIDWVDTPSKKGFEIRNPNKKAP
jgi:iron-sulfur cluster assembly protein